MREYEFVATDDTIEALRRLRAPWAGYTVDRSSLRVLLADGTTMRVDVDGADLEPDFEAFRIEAAVERSPIPIAPHASPFGAGKNDVVVFRGETWIEGPAQAAPTDAIMQYSGRPGQCSDTALAVCKTTDAVLFASTQGTGVLVQLSAAPYQLDITEDRVVIARFLAQRGYSE